MVRANKSLNSKRIAPGPPGRLLLGSMREFRRDTLGVLDGWRKRYGDLVRFRLGPKVFYVVSHPELAEEVLIHQKDVFVKHYNPNRPKGLALVLGNGLVTSDGEQWHRQRRTMQPFFNSHRLEAMSAKMIEAGARALHRWEQHDPGQRLDIASEMMQLTLEVITQTMFTTSVLEHVKTIGPALTVALKYAVRNQQSPFMPPLFVPTKANLEFKRAMTALDKLIDQRRNEDGDFDDLLDLLMRTDADRDPMRSNGDRLLRDEVMTIFTAGHETTANALSWTWYMLDKNPRVCSKLREELETVLGGRTPALNDLARLSYTRQVIEEALRYFPPVAGILRKVAHDATLWNYEIPENSLVLVNIYGIHRHPNFWNDPETINPDRFRKASIATQHRLAYMPFGAGPRACIGKQFAMLEAHLLLAMIAQRYELRMADGRPVEPEVAVSLRPKHGLPMTIHRL